MQATLRDNECPVLDCNQDYPPSSWKESPIANSFEEWLMKMFEHVIHYKSLPEYWFTDTLNAGSLGRIG
ncbi:MAG: hypothetical protein MUF49_13255 [Oculatellaceae cyanobacterium Prado106]|jgi:hypothetical protein|nr:hypothetical protein [Oculatellaceae cyanobacterium Prado106]